MTDNTKHSIRQIAIIGTGVIGTGWAARFLGQGYRVFAWDPAPDFYPRLQDNIRRLWPTLEKLGVTSEAGLNNLECAATLESACRHADLIQENVPEDIEIKRAIHVQIGEAAKTDAIVASSSSGLLPSEIQKDCHRPERLLIAHPFNPVYLLPLV